MGRDDLEARAAAKDKWVSCPPHLVPGKTGGPPRAIRLLPTRPLCTLLVKYKGTTDERWQHLVSEVQRRYDQGLIRAQVPKYLFHHVLKVVDAKCACGHRGLYINHFTVYCRRCHPRAVQARHVYTRMLERGKARRETQLNEKDKGMRRAEQHHRACGQKKGSSPGVRQ